MRSICGGLIDGMWYECPFMINEVHGELIFNALKNVG